MNHVILLILTLTLPLMASAQFKSHSNGSWSCITSVDESLSEYVSSVEFKPYTELLAEYGANNYYLIPVGRGLQCKEVAKVKSSLRAVAVITSVAGLMATCSGVGAPVSLLTQGLSLAFIALSLHIGSLPCDDYVNSAQHEQGIKDLACDALIGTGIMCVPSELEYDVSFDSQMI